MRKLIALVLVVMVTLAFTASAFAVGPGKKLEFEGGGAGKVVFDGDKHKVNKCNDCHPAVFKMKKGTAKMTMKEMQEGKLCGTCHNGTKAFGVKEADSCAKCHKK